MLKHMCYRDINILILFTETPPPPYSRIAMDDVKHKGEF